MSQDALEKMHTDASGVPGPKPDGPTWLNTLEVVDGIVRDFTVDAIKRIGEPDLLQWIERRARELNEAFMGRGYADPIIYATGPWNTPEFIGEYCLRHLQINGDPRLGPMMALMKCAADTIQLVVAHEGEEPDEFGPEMERIQERTRNALLGLPVQL